MNEKTKGQLNTRIQTPAFGAADVREVRIYTEPNNRACEAAKDLLELRGIPFREINVEEDYLLRGWIAWATGQRTLPQIFIDGEPAGGIMELIQLDESDQLMKMVIR